MVTDHNLGNCILQDKHSITPIHCFTFPKKHLYTIKKQWLPRLGQPLCKTKVWLLSFDDHQLAMCINLIVFAVDDKEVGTIGKAIRRDAELLGSCLYHTLL